MNARAKALLDDELGFKGTGRAFIYEPTEAAEAIYGAALRAIKSAAAQERAAIIAFGRRSGSHDVLTFCNEIEKGGHL
jgi:hypothetical protein